MRIKNPGIEGGTNICWCPGWDECLLVLRVGRIFAVVEGGTNVYWYPGWDEYLLVLRLGRIFAGIQGGTNVSWCRGWDEREPGTKIIGGMAKN